VPDLWPEWVGVFLSRFEFRVWNLLEPFERFYISSALSPDERIGDLPEVWRANDDHMHEVWHTACD
jgi:hypothetical protein